MKRLLAIALLVSACGATVQPSSSAAPTTAPTPGVTPRDLTSSPTAGAVTSEPSAIPIDDVPVGLCFDEDHSPLTGRIFAVIVPCGGTHQLELIGRDLLRDGPEAPYPGAQAMAAHGERICRPLFESYVGIDYDRSELVFWYYTPDELDWPFADRSVFCAIGNAERSMQPPGSVKNARR